MKRIGYVLSGGGARGFAHLGVIKLLEEIGIRPFAISGTSVGAVMGALYAAGKKPAEILTLLENKKYFGWSSFTFRKEGFFSMEILRRILDENIEKNDFDALKIKLFVAATDLVKGESVIFSKGELFDAVVASASIPVIFEPIKKGNKLLVDGGVLNNLPVEPLTDICDVIIGSHVNQAGEGLHRNSFFKTVNMLDRCFHLAIANATYLKAAKCTVFIETALQGYNTYDIKNADKIFEEGYKAALPYRERLSELANNELPVT